MIATCECRTKAEAKRKAAEARKIVSCSLSVTIRGSRGKWTVRAWILECDVERWFRMMLEQAQEGTK